MRNLVKKFLFKLFKEDFDKLEGDIKFLRGKIAPRFNEYAKCERCGKVDFQANMVKEVVARAKRHCRIKYHDFVPICERSTCDGCPSYVAYESELVTLYKHKHCRRKKDA